jgi:signal transduction histidine kinase
LSRSRAPEEYKAVLRRIAGEGQRLRHIVDDLLWLARIDDQRFSAPDDQDADVAAIVVASVGRFQPIAAGNKVGLGVDVTEARMAHVHAEPGWIDRLVGVLVDNACKYAGKGGRVDVSVRTAGSRVVLQIDDSGPGIPVEQRPLVLDRFHRGVDGPGGTGLGLAIADSVVRATNGAWLIGDAPSGGARFEVSWRNASPARVRAPEPTREESDAQFVSESAQSSMEGTAPPQPASTTAPSRRTPAP